ncbi:MAG TPA: AI-2E family transporter [Gammaproteobacteria bacterium]
MPVAAAPREGPRSLYVAARLVSIAIVVAALWVGQVVLIPIALAAIVTFLMSPLVTRLDRLGVPRVLAVLVVSGAATGVLAGVGYLVVGQLGQLAEELPEYRDNIRAKLADLRELTRGGTIERVQSTIRDISEDVESDAAEEQGADRAAETPVELDEPVRVQIEESRQILGEAERLTPVASAAATAGLTMLLSIFMLIKREDLRNRLVSLAGHTSIVVTTKAFAEAGQRISRYLLMQFIINATMGLAVGIGLYFIGVPYAALWGLSAAVLRYVPYIGPWIAALLPISVSLITAPGWEQVVIVITMFVVLELLSNNVMEPLLYGQSVGLSAIAVIVSAIFWTWIWGPIGLVLATPMTACIVVLARYVPELAFIDRLMSEGPALKPHLSLYQRLLARDEDEAADIVDAYRESHTLEETCDELLLGALLALKRDLAADRILRDDGDFVASALDELVDELADAVAEEGAEARDGAAASARRPLVIGLPVRDRVDEIALELLGVLLKKEPCELDVVSAEALVGEKIAEVETRRPAAVCVVTLPPGDLTATRHAAKRLRARVPGVAVIVGRLGGGAAAARSRHLLRTAGVRDVGFSLAKLAELLGQIVREAARTPAEDAVAGEGTPELTAAR